MLNYGAYSQKYFENKSSITPDADAIANVTAQTIDRSYDNTTEILPEGTTFEGSTLSLESKTTMSLYFKSNKELTFTKDGTTLPTESKDGYQIVRIEDIAANELNDDMSVEVCDGTDTGCVSYCPMTYCYNVLNKGSYDTDLQNIVKALYNYYLAASRY